MPFSDKNTGCQRKKHLKKNEKESFYIQNFLILSNHAKFSKG